MDWAKGYSASYYLSILDKETLRDVDRIELIGGSIKRSYSDLRESASVDCRGYDSKKEQYIRIWLDVKQEGESSHTPLFTGIATSPRHQYSGRVKSNTIECYSLLKIAQDVMLPRGWYAPVEADGAKLVKQLLSIIGLPYSYIIVAENSPALTQSIIAEQGENYLSMANKILDSINWTMKLDGYGRINIIPIEKDPEPKIMFDGNEMDIIESEISITYDWYNAPNVLRCILDDDYALARDDDPRSALSTVSRGREVWYEDTDVMLNTNETLAEYAQRMLKVYQRNSTEISYSRRYYPGIYPGDCIRLNYPAQGISGLFLISEQDITLGYNAKTSEEVVQA